MNKRQSSDIPSPAPMPVDREQWLARLDISNFINTYYQCRDIKGLSSCKKILIVGLGQGLDAAVFKWQGYDVTTFDIDEAFHPNYVGSVHDMQFFSDKEFDAVIASHVLEHLPLPYLDTALAEISRVSRFSLIYLPVHGRHFQLRLNPGFSRGCVSVNVDLFNYMARPDGIVPRYMAGQHYWEVGMRGFRVRDIKKRFSKNFHILKSYRNKDWLPSYNFVLRSN